MARRTVFQLIDDLDQTPLADGEGETVLFSLDGNNYEIDLSRDHARLLRAALEKYVDKARVLSKSRGKSAGRAAATAPASSKRDLAAIRAWATANDHKVSERGRIPNAVLEAFDAAHSK